MRHCHLLTASAYLHRAVVIFTFRFEHGPTDFFHYLCVYYPASLWA